MPNDDLGTFPMPPQAPTSPVEPTVPDTASAPTQPDPITPPDSASTITPSQSSPIESSVSPDNVSPTPDSTISPTFEETPDEIPSFQNSTSPSSAPMDSSPVESPIPQPEIQEPQLDIAREQENLVTANEELIEKQSDPAPVAPTPVEIQPQPGPYNPPVETPATLPPKTGGSSLAPVIIVILLVIAGIGLAFSAYLSAQTSQLKKQLEEITQTKEKQETILTPTSTPTVYEAPSPTISPNASESATPSATPTVSMNSNSLQPLANAASALKIAINKSPNAQLILIKIDNATDTTTAVTKYFFRQDLSTKKYFYVAVAGKGIPEIVDKQVVVSPDDNIPSLNDSILTNKLGIDLDAALKLTYAQCANQETCTTAPVKAQFIKSGSGIIWQLSLYTKGQSASPLLIQINSETKEILYKSPEFANK